MQDEERERRNCLKRTIGLKICTLFQRKLKCKQIKSQT